MNGALRVSRILALVVLSSVFGVVLPLTAVGANQMESSIFTGTGMLSAADRPNFLPFMGMGCDDPGHALAHNYNGEGAFVGLLVVGDDEVIRIDSEVSWKGMSSECEMGTNTGTIEDFGISPGSAGDFSLDSGSSTGWFTRSGSVLTMQVSGTCRHDSREGTCLLHFHGGWIPLEHNNGSQPISASVAGTLTIFCPLTEDEGGFC